MNAGERDEANCHYERVEKEHVEPGIAPKHTNNSIATVPKKRIVVEVQHQVKKSLIAIREVV